MRKKVSLKEIIFAVKLSVLPIWCWPLSKNATRLKKFYMKLYHSWCIIMAICLELPLLYGISRHINDPDILVQQLTLASSSIHNVTDKMENFCDLMKPHEEVVIRRYINKCIVFYSASIITFYLTTTGTITVLPYLLNQPFPTLAEYPFDVFYQPLKTIIYVQQSIVGIIMAGQLCMNIYVTLLIWFTSAKFEILVEELKEVTSVYSLFKWIQTHQELLKYAEEVVIIVRPFAFSSICCSTFAIILVFLTFVTQDSTAIVWQLVGLSFTCISEVYIFAWPGGHLISTCIDVAEAAYNAFQTRKQSIKVQKCLQIIIMRSQKPIIISIPCFLTALSVNYFTSYCSTILSYFTTLRVMLEEDND